MVEPRRPPVPSESIGYGGGQWSDSYISRKYTILFHPKDHWTLQWKGLNLYSRNRVLKIASFEASGYLGQVTLLQNRLPDYTGCPWAPLCPIPMITFFSCLLLLKDHPKTTITISPYGNTISASLRIRDPCSIPKQTYIYINIYLEPKWPLF